MRKRTRNAGLPWCASRADAFLCLALAFLPFGCALPAEFLGRTNRTPAVAPTASVAHPANLDAAKKPRPGEPAEHDGEEVTLVCFAIPRPGAASTGAQPPEEKGGKPEKEETLPAPRSVPSADLTIDQIINATLLADPKIRAGLEAINQANADLLTSSLLPNPTYTGDAQLLPLTRPFTVDKQGGPPQTDHQISYGIDWFLFGKRAAALASASAQVRVSEADYGDTVRQRVRDAAVAFYDVLEAKALLDLARQDLKNLRRVEEATRKGLEAGGRTPVDLNRVRLDVLKSEQTLREAESTLVVARAKLRALIGRRDPDPGFDVNGNLDATLAAQPLPVEESLAVAQENRPDIASLRLQIDKAARDVRTEHTKAFPQVTPQLGYTRQFQEKAIGFPDANSWSVSLNMALPFFDRNQGNRAKSQSVLAQNTLNLETGLTDLRAEIVQVVQDFQTSYQTATAVAGEQLKAATEVLNSITKAYEDAKGRSLLDVLDAQRNYRETYRLYISSRANYWRASYRYNAALGKQVLPHEQHLLRSPACPGP
jgi:cobalt-zinc-cadmium efflux system outer membrane protein